jgi:Dyp-type peroxidase family
MKPWWKYNVDQRDLQGNVLAGYGNSYRHALYAFVRVETGAAGRGWLGVLTPMVTDAVSTPRRDRPDYTVNVSLSWQGLRALGVPGPMLDKFPEEFRAGMAERANLLGDTGSSGPNCWDERLGRQEADILLTVHGLDRPALEKGRRECLARVEAPGSGLEIYHEEPAALLGDPAEGAAGREHFGFADGFAQPTIKGNAGPYSRRGGGTPKRFGRWGDVAPGEFVLGYPAEDGTYAREPPEPLRRSGTFTVVRKLEQKVDIFTRYLREVSGGSPAREEWLAAGIVGRWRDGTPLMKSPNRPNPSVAADRGRNGRANDFRYKSDQVGSICPLGAHIRRANPRDAFGWQGRLTKRHRIIRRGMPYGDSPADPAKPDGKDRGLMFVCHQSSIARQFEVIQSQWLKDGDPFWLGSEPDLLTCGALGEGMTLQSSPPIFLAKPEPFVVTRGGGYFFTPGIGALRTIAAGGWL